MDIKRLRAKKIACAILFRKLTMKVYAMSIPPMGIQPFMFSQLSDDQNFIASAFALSYTRKELFYCLNFSFQLNFHSGSSTSIRFVFEEFLYESHLNISRICKLEEGGQRKSVQTFGQIFLACQQFR